MNFPSFFKKVFSGEIKFNLLGRGNYNRVYLSEGEFEINELSTQWVCKRPLLDPDEQHSLNDPERACRKWQEINPSYPAYLSENKRFWFMPYLGKIKASDERTARSIVDIYQRTGNIVADGGIHTNFVKVDDHATCIDVDLAIRRKSISSELFFNEMISTEHFDRFFVNLHYQNRPKTLICIKVLFFLEDCLARDEFDHQLMNLNLLNYCYYFASHGYAIDLTIYHNLLILSQHTFEEIPEYCHPLYISHLPKCENYQELTTYLNHIYEKYNVSRLKSHAKDISVEDEVEKLLVKLVGQVEKKVVFEDHFFANLTKRTFFTPSAVKVDDDLESDSSATLAKLQLMQ